jgi:DEAD/DEAH box helicase domain-containing protein
MSQNQIILDVETQRSFDAVGGYYPEKLGVSFVGVIHRQFSSPHQLSSEKRYELFESQLEELWPLLETADVIIGFNLISFDLPTFIPYYSGDIKKLPALDLLVRVKDSIGRRISLDSLAQETLHTKKTGHGLDAIRYFENQEFDKLAHYCMKDVEITRDLYDFGLKEGYVSYKNHWNNLVKAPVDFSFTTPHSALQMSLV